MYDRLDTLRARAAGRLAGVLRSDRGGTQQGRTERDNLAGAGAARVAQLDAAEEGLCFGRLDLDGGERRYVGRIGILDDGGDFEPLLVDWRAPAARPFYVATSAAPHGVRRRRSIRTRFRTVVGLDDDVLDLDAAAEGAGGDGSGLVGEGALLAALGAGRTGRMRDVVETIQAEQDTAIRSELRGVLVVQGGPGTGKTAVALHRAAYLLYTYRERLAKRGVLIVGPNPTFLRYVSHVLPALGETSAVLATVPELFPGVQASRTDAPEVAEIKGRAVLADVIAGAVRARQRVPEDALEVVYEGVKYRLERETCAAAREAGRGAHRLPNFGRKAFADHLVDALAGQVVDRLNDDPHRQETLALVNLIAAELGEEASDMADGVFLGREDRDRIAEALAEEPSVQEALDWLWPQLTPQRLLAELFATPELLREAVLEASGLGADSTGGISTTDGTGAAGAAGSADVQAVLTDAEIDLLLRTPGGWSAADIPLLDEAAELLGDVDTAQAARRAEAARRARIAYAQGALEVAEGSRSIDLEDPREEITTAVDLVSAEMLAERFEEEDARSVAERAMADRTWTFGHVIVDEAQELSPMAWRVLMRRCPARSMTLVGDVAQTGDPAGARSWGQMLAPHVGDRWRLAELTVNYRTPAEIMAVAAEVLHRIDPDLTPPRSVRSTGEEPRTVPVPAAELVERVAELAAAEDAALAAGDAGTDGSDGAGGRLAVLVPAGLAADVAAAVLARLPEAGFGPDPDLERRTVVLPVRQAKGLEFDTVLVVEPDAVAAAVPHGENDLYVALTRATRRLVIVESED